MKILKINVLIIALILWSAKLINAQTTSAKKTEVSKTAQANKPAEVKEKKWRIGAMFTNAWTTLPGYTAEKTFYKPSLGGFLYGEYMFIPWVGIGLGAGYTQRGAGVIYNNVVQPGPGDVDSTFRNRIRSNNIIVPLGLVLKAPLWKGAKFSLFGGGAFNYAWSGERVYVDVEAGNHISTPQTDLYKKVDFLLHASAGLDIQAGSSTVLRVHFLYNEGFQKVYRGDLSQPYSGKNRSLGIQLGVMF